MANSLVGSIINGEYTKTAASTEATKSNSTTSTSKTAAKSGTDYNEEMFLQLLVAEMQYQDPLEPTDNGEYVSQLASFTQIEAIQSVQADMKTIQANSLVGKMVIINDDNTMVSGKVDYVMNDDDQLYLSVNDKLYEIEKLDSVVDESYYNAVIDAETFTDAVSQLPSAELLTLSDEADVASARSKYDAMNDYTKGFVADETVNTLKSLENRIAALKKAKEEADNDSVSTSEDENEVEEA